MSHARMKTVFLHFFLLSPLVHFFVLLQLLENLVFVEPGFRGISTFLVLKTEGLPHCEGRKMIKVNGYTFRGSNSVIFIVASHLNWGQLN